MMENDEVEILWYFNVETDHVIIHRRPHIAIFEKKEKNALLMKIGSPRVSEELFREHTFS